MKALVLTICISLGIFFGQNAHAELQIVSGLLGQCSPSHIQYTPPTARQGTNPLRRDLSPPTNFTFAFTYLYTPTDPNYCSSFSVWASPAGSGNYTNITNFGDVYPGQSWSEAYQTFTLTVMNSGSASVCQNTYSVISANGMTQSQIASPNIPGSLAVLGGVSYPNVYFFDGTSN